MHYENCIITPALVMFIFSLQKLLMM